jgi:hypothetical protein
LSISYFPLFRTEFLRLLIASHIEKRQAIVDHPERLMKQPGFHEQLWPP